MLFNACRIRRKLAYNRYMQRAEDVKISTVHKGDALEDAFYEYLIGQKESGKLVDGLYQPELCEIHKKKRYYCSEREANVTFDVVIEIKRDNAKGFALVIVFECKNYEGGVPENEVTDFSDKLQRIFKHNVKGALVFSSKLQSGAMNLAKKRGLGLIKYDQCGFEYIVQRQAGRLIDSSYIKNSMFLSANNYKSMKFSAYCDGAFYNSLADLMGSWLGDRESNNSDNQSVSLQYISYEDMEARAANLLSQISYQDGVVNLPKICDSLSLELEYTEETCIDSDGNEVLGEADFVRRCIKIYHHDMRNRGRFTLAHEIGHFYLGHDKFLGSESVVKDDLFIDDQPDANNFYRNMEFQANTFASCLLLPKVPLFKKILEITSLYKIPTHRYFIYVDNQPCNLKDYNLLMNELVGSFEVTKTAIEIRLKKLNFLTDNRETYNYFIC